MFNEFTSFPDIETAEWAQTEVLKYNKDAIIKWFNDAKVGDRKGVKIMNLGRETGYGLRTGETICTPRYGTFVKIEKISDTRMGIKTSYPIGDKQ